MIHSLTKFLPLQIQDPWTKTVKEYVKVVKICESFCHVLSNWSGTRDLRCPNCPASNHIFGVDQLIIKTELAHDGAWPKFQSLTLLRLDHIDGKMKFFKRNGLRSRTLSQVRLKLAIWYHSSDTLQCSSPEGHCAGLSLMVNPAVRIKSWTRFCLFECS